MRSGKDTVAQFIIDGRKDQYDIRRYGLADELKREVNELAEKSGGMKALFSEGHRYEGFGYMQANGNILALPSWVQYDNNAPMDDPLCPLGKQRAFLQWYGSEFRRSVEPDYWIKKISARIEKEKPEIAVVPDVRFLNEFRWAKEYGECLKVERPNVDIGTAMHVSEMEMATVPDHEWGAVLVNDRGLEELKQLALYTFDEILDSVPQ